MAQLTWIQGSLLLILQLTVTADETSVLTRAGDEVTLSCSTVIKGQQQCNETSEGKVQLTAKPGNKNSEKTRPETDNVPRNFQAPIIAVAVVSVIILIVVLVIVRWRAKGKKPPADENAVDLEDNVSYATISHGKNTKRNAEAGGDHDAVTYSTVRACSSSAAASDDPNSVYSVITSTTN
ncbi:uncharacterized protein LOC118558331 isoform X2 [Fundulus heteroclitus]|uniref:uncharacterized protein LOC118558331 isoform X2 n=1 Tax=Fundulus heteroclitus TaxID=8078 RepID=UPI00165A90D5|nr:uncharacterized protein LOC118558331 isoform X2 [Fundulus heteroclitus]